MRTSYFTNFQLFGEWMNQSVTDLINFARYRGAFAPKNQKQAGAGAVPSSGLVNSLVKIEFF